jgi:hypothetical protein
MNIEYRILWFEDMPQSIDSIIEEIQEYVEDELGFKFVVPQIEPGSGNVNYLKYSDYDLIVMDYKLRGNEKGDLIIKKIRDLQIYTDVVFYSSSPIEELRASVHANELDGVYCTSRTEAVLINKLKQIILTTVKKVQDLNNMRGLVMAEVSDIDEKMLTIIGLYIKFIDGKTANDFLIKRKNKVLSSILERHKQFEKLELDSIISDWSFDASHKWRTIKEIACKFKKDQIQACLELYETEISQKRNKLAHVKEIIDKDGNRILSNSEFVFNDTICRELRVDLKKHSANLDELAKCIK